jgi:hypothetical protein
VPEVLFGGLTVAIAAFGLAPAGHFRLLPALAGLN